jgi:hypothetical protein
VCINIQTVEEVTLECDHHCKQLISKIRCIVCIISIPTKGMKSMLLLVVILSLIVVQLKGAHELLTILHSAFKCLSISGKFVLVCLVKKGCIMYCLVRWLYLLFWSVSNESISETGNYGRCNESYILSRSRDFSLGSSFIIFC